MKQTIAFLAAWLLLISASQGADKKDLYVVKVGASWCAPCVKMNNEVWVDKKIKEEVKKFKNSKVYHVDYDKHTDWCIKYKVDRLPTVLIMDTEGNVLKRGTGYADVNKLLNFLSAPPKEVATNGEVPKEEVFIFGAATILKWVTIGLAKLILLILG